MARVYPRWKEELVWESGRERLVFEFTMGVSHVYFPTIEKWRAKNSELTEAHYDAVLGDIRAWAGREGVPLTVEARAWVAIEGS